MILNKELPTAGLRQNLAKREIVPKLRHRENKKLESLGPGGRVLPWAGHLGGAYTFNGANRAELARRMSSMRVGWISMGRVWTSTYRKIFKRTVFMGKVVEAGLAGLEPYVFWAGSFDNWTADATST